METDWFNGDTLDQSHLNIQPKTEQFDEEEEEEDEFYERYFNGL